MGRPLSFTSDVKEEICTRLMEGRSLRDICEDADMPTQTTVYKHLAADRDFAESYARAREVQADALFDEILTIANTPVIGVETKTKPDGTVETTHGDMLGHRRLQIDARKWMAGKLRPKVYGEKLDLNHSGQIAIPREMTEDELVRIATGSGT